MKNIILRKKKQQVAKREKKMANQLSLKEEEMLAEKVKHFSVLHRKQVKGYKERDVVTNAWDTVASDLEFPENSKIMFFFFCQSTISKPKI